MQNLQSQWLGYRHADSLENKKFQGHTRNQGFDMVAATASTRAQGSRRSVAALTQAGASSEKSTEPERQVLRAGPCLPPQPGPPGGSANPVELGFLFFFLNRAQLVLHLFTELRAMLKPPKNVSSENLRQHRRCSRSGVPENSVFF